MSIILDHINYCYSADSAYKVQALKDVSLEINDGEFIGIIGHTGSGKSTLIQHMNGLLKATSGHIYYNGQDIYDNDYDLSLLGRCKVANQNKADYFISIHANGFYFKDSNGNTVGTVDVYNGKDAENIEAISEDFIRGLFE